MNELQKTVDEAVQAVASWREHVAKISQAINSAHVAIADANEIRERHALGASLNEPDAVAALKKARAESTEAEHSLRDLTTALDGAQIRLKESISAETSARRALNQHAAEVAMRERVMVAAKLDAVFAEMATLYEQYIDLGQQIVNLDILPRSFAGVSDHEGAMGARRVRAAMPRFMWSLFPGALHDELKNEPLEVTEARHFGLNVEFGAPESKAA